MLPIERYYPGSMLLKNSAVYDQEIGKDYVPKNADDFKRVLQQLNKPSQNIWAMGSYINQMYYIYFYAAMFGAPNSWVLDSSGKLTKDIETPQYKEALNYVRDLVVAGLYHPVCADHRGQHDRPQRPDRLEVRAGCGNVWECLARCLDSRPEVESSGHTPGSLAVPGPRRWQAAALFRTWLSWQHGIQEGSP